MFKSNPNFNEYYGLIYQINHKSNKLKRTECSNEKIQSSKKSFSQDSRSNGETSLHKKKKHLQDFMNRRQHEHQNKTNGKINSPESPKAQNILDLFKRKDLQEGKNLKESDDLYPETRSKKYYGINYNKNSSKQINQINSVQKYQLGEYFENSIDLKNIRSGQNSSRSRSLRNKSQKSPLRMLKSKSRQELYSPVEKMLNIIKQEQKARQLKTQNQKTIKNINYIRSLNELNETHMNYPAIKQVPSEKNFYEIEPESHKKKKNLNLARHYEISNSKNIQLGKNELSHKKSLFKKLQTSESQIVFQSSHKQHEKPKISSSKIKKYFNRKQQIEKDKMKMRDLLENIGTKKEIARLRKIQSQRVFLHSNSESNQSEASQSRVFNNRISSKNQIYLENKQSYSSGQQDSQNKNGSIYEYSDYGFQVKNNSYQQEIQNQKFYKTPKKNVESYEIQSIQISPSPVRKMIERLKSFQDSKLKVIINDSEIEHNKVNSIASIQKRMPKKQYKQDSYIQSQKSKVSMKSSQCEINVHEPKQSKFQNQKCVNTLTYQQKLTEKKPKQSIISKLKKDIAKDKIKSAKKLKLVDSKLSKKQTEISKKVKQQISSSYLSGNEDSRRQNSNNPQTSSYIKSLNNIKIESIAKISKDEQISCLAVSNKGNKYSDLSDSQLRHKNTKQSQNLLKPLNIQNMGKSEILDNNQMNRHGLSKFESIQSESKSSKRISQVDSMINSNKIGQSKLRESQSAKNLSQLNQNKKSSIKNSKNYENQDNKTKKQVQENKAIKFLKSIKKSDNALPVSISKYQESNLESLTGSYQTSSITLSQGTLLGSNSCQSSKFVNSTQKKNIDQSKSNIIKEEENNQSQSQKSESNIDMSQSSSVYTQSVKKSKNMKKKKFESEYSQSYQSLSPTVNNANTYRMSQSQRNPKQKQNSDFSLSSSSANNSNSISKSSSLSSISKKLAHANKFNSIPKNDSFVFRKKKNFAEYTLNDVARYIEEHEFRIQSYCFYIDNSKNTYQEDYELQKIQLLSFLMLKKNVFELNRVIAALKGTGTNVFTLTGIEILDEVLDDYRDREEITLQLNNIIKYQKQTIKEFHETYHSLEKKYLGEKGFNLNLEKDDFTSEIVKKLGQQLNNLYQKWEKNKSHGENVTAKKISQKFEKRMIEIIEIIFLASEIDGQKVKIFQMLESDVEFLSYYEKWYEKIIQTIEHFDQKSKYSN